MLTDMKIEAATEPGSLQSIDHYGIEDADGHPEERVDLEVELTELGERAPVSQILSDLVVAATRTPHAAVEVWGPTTPGTAWPYMVAPWVDFETIGACAAAGRSRVSFGGEPL
ncbi:MAG: hypothetical protein WCD21_40635 [Streptomyces sp.]